MSNRIDRLNSSTCATLSVGELMDVLLDRLQNTNGIEIVDTHGK